MMINFSLVVRNVKDYQDFEKLHSVLSEYDLINYVFDEGAYFEKEKEAIFVSWEEENWEAYNGQMITISEKLKKMTFELTCQYENQFWRVYYKDGQTETCAGDVVFERPRKISWDSLLVF